MLYSMLPFTIGKYLHRYNYLQLAGTIVAPRFSWDIYFKLENFNIKSGNACAKSRCILSPEKLHGKVWNFEIVLLLQCL